MEVTRILTSLREKIRRKYLLWVSGYNNWETYERMTDPGVFWRAGTLSVFYHGYPYVHCFENRSHHVYYADIARSGMGEMYQWCEESCKEKFRFDAHRMSKSQNGEWEFNELLGGDYVCAAFKSETDYMWFLLRWS